MVTGTVLLLAALFLLLFNWNQDAQTEERTVNILEQLKEQMPAAHTKRDETSGIPSEMLQTEIAVGTDIDLLPAETALPEPDIFAEYEDEISDTVQEVVYWIDSTSNLVIAAHNYSCHFGNISSLNTGDEIIFTDGEGIMHTYSVVNSELIGGRNVPAMEEGSEDWDITLFTCNLSGTNRVTVRAALAE